MQVTAAAMDPSMFLPAEAAAAEARVALEAGRTHLVYLEDAIAAAERHQQSQVQRTYNCCLIQSIY